ncbi:MAG TPA: PIN domain-containing protein [Thermoanaerobaculia bacterium]
MIVLDTSVLSHVFRRPSARQAESVVVGHFSALVSEGHPLVIPGVVLQELLSGIRDERQFERLRIALEGFPLILAEGEDHVEAARLMNVVRGRGIAASSFDMLIAATTIRRRARLFTLDRDFERLAPLIPLTLLELPA